MKKAGSCQKLRGHPVSTATKFTFILSQCHPGMLGLLPNFQHIVWNTFVNMNVSTVVQVWSEYFVL